MMLPRSAPKSNKLFLNTPSRVSHDPIEIARRARKSCSSKPLVTTDFFADSASGKLLQAFGFVIHSFLLRNLTTRIAVDCPLSAPSTPSLDIEICPMLRALQAILQLQKVVVASRWNEARPIHRPRTVHHGASCTAAQSTSENETATGP